MKKWKIIARSGDHQTTLTYDAIGDAKRAWVHMARHKVAMDTGNTVDTAMIFMPNGDIYYLGEGVSWR